MRSLMLMLSVMSTVGCSRMGSDAPAASSSLATAAASDRQVIRITEDMPGYTGRIVLRRVN